MLYVAAAGRFEGQELGSVQKVLAHISPCISRISPPYLPGSVQKVLAA